MKIALYEVGQYTDTKCFYIGRLEEISSYGTVKRVIVMQGIKTRQEAKAWLKTYNSQGLKPAEETTKTRII